MAAASLVLSGCTSAPASSGSASGATTVAAKCGLANGKKASGDPIKLGAIVVDQPGVDFSQITDLANAYFDCVNDNGGINGRPIKYIVKKEQSDPQQVASDATELVETDGVLGMVGNASLIDCPVNSGYYKKMGINAIVAGVPTECFNSPNFAPVNFGPYYASIAAAQQLVTKGIKRLVVVTADTPGGTYANSGAVEYAKEHGVSGDNLMETVPLNDANGLALRLVADAGSDGGVLVNFSPPNLIKLFAAIKQQGLIKRVKWACVSCIDDSIVSSMGSDWNNQLTYIDEFGLTSSNDKDTALYRAVTKKYASSVPLGNFGQMGFLMGQIMTNILLKLPASELTQAGVNKAIAAAKPVSSGMFCSPWYFGTQDVHVPNNSAHVLSSADGTYKQEGGCLKIAALPGNNLDSIRQYEQSQGISK